MNRLMCVRRMVWGLGLCVACGSPSAWGLIQNPGLNYRVDTLVSGGVITDADARDDTFGGFGSLLLEAETVVTGGGRADSSLDFTLEPTRFSGELAASYGTVSGDARASSRANLLFGLDEAVEMTWSGLGSSSVGPGELFAQLSRRFPTQTIQEASGLTLDLGALNPNPVRLESGSYSLVLRGESRSFRDGGQLNALVGQTSLAFSIEFALPGAGGISGDYNGNGSVEQGDLDLVLGNWGGVRGFEDGVTAFTTGDVDQEELDVVLTTWGSSSSPTFEGLNVPEPGLVMGLCAAACAFMTRRRRWA